MAFSSTTTKKLLLFDGGIIILDSSRIESVVTSITKNCLILRLHSGDAIKIKWIHDPEKFITSMMNIPNDHFENWTPVFASAEATKIPADPVKDQRDK